MRFAFVLINTDLEQMETVLKALKEFDAVEEAYKVYGGYDIVAKVKADTLERLGEIVSFHIRLVFGVLSTQILIINDKRNNAQT
jgi:DNA-binding Lrp family transcriptional regulator